MTTDRIYLLTRCLRLEQALMGERLRATKQAQRAARWRYYAERAARLIGKPIRRKEQEQELGL